MPLVMCPTRMQFPLSYSCLYHLLRHYLFLKLYEGQRYVCTVGKGRGRDRHLCKDYSKRLEAHVEGHRNRWRHITRSLHGGVQEAHTWAPEAGLTHPLCLQGRNWVLLKMHCHRLLSPLILLGARQEGVDSQKKIQW